MSIFIITLAGGAAFFFIQQNFNLWRSASSSLQAIYMAQEALEVARNIRDGNYLEPKAPKTKTPEAVPIIKEKTITTTIISISVNPVEIFFFFAITFIAIYLIYLK